MVPAHVLWGFGSGRNPKSGALDWQMLSGLCLLSFLTAAGHRTRSHTPVTLASAEDQVLSVSLGQLIPSVALWFFTISKKQKDWDYSANQLNNSLTFSNVIVIKYNFFTSKPLLYSLFFSSK